MKTREDEENMKALNEQVSAVKDTWRVDELLLTKVLRDAAASCTEKGLLSEAHYHKYQRSSKFEINT